MGENLNEIIGQPASLKKNYPGNDEFDLVELLEIFSLAFDSDRSKVLSYSFFNLVLERMKCLVACGEEQGIDSIFFRNKISFGLIVVGAS
jgi:hypothetical protein